MGNNNSSNTLSTDLIDTSIPTNDNVFKVDNINSYGCKHASAKIQISIDSLCIRQKRRQSLHIPLDTIKRYGLDGSIFILECGRRAPLGQARYAFRCKQARHLVDCLDQRITMRSKQLLEQQRGTTRSSSSTLTDVTSTTHQRRRTQSDQGCARRTPSSILFSSSSSIISLTSKGTFSYRNSEPNMSQNYLPFDAIPSHINSNNNNNTNHHHHHHNKQCQGQFIAKLKPPVEKQLLPELNYVDFKTDSMMTSTNDEDLSTELEIPIATEEIDNELLEDSSIQQTPKRIVSYYHQCKSNKMNPINQNNSLALNASSSTKLPYVYIDHEKTTTLKEIADERFQQCQARRLEI